VSTISGPAFLTGSAANIYSPPSSPGYVIINHIHIANTDVSTAYTYTLYKGLTGGSASGTELAKAKTVNGAAVDDLFFSPGLVMSTTDFLSGLASTTNKLTITVMGQKMMLPF
jgi:hypothetical protein